MSKSHRYYKSEECNLSTAKTKFFYVSINEGMYEYHFAPNYDGEYIPLFETLNKLNSRIDDLEKKNKELEDELLAIKYAPPNVKFNEALEDWNYRVNKDNDNN